MSKPEPRRRFILELVATRNLATQEALAEALADAGWEVTQSSVSRDITALGLVKIDGHYRPPPRGAATAGDPDARAVRDGVLDAKPAGDCLIVVRTRVDEAGRLASALDRLAWPGLAGTVAGLDTIFAACADRASRDQLLKRLRKSQR